MINKWVRIFGFHWKNRRGGPNHKAPLRTFSMFLCTPRKTNMTGWNTNHFKTYLLLYMVILLCHVFFFWGGGTKTLRTLKFHYLCLMDHAK